MAKIGNGKNKTWRNFQWSNLAKIVKKSKSDFEKFIRLDRQKFAVNLFLKQFETGSVTGFGEISQL